MLKMIHIVAEMRSNCVHSLTFSIVSTPKGNYIISLMQMLNDRLCSAGHVYSVKRFNM